MFVSGSATDYLDLLDKVRSYVTTSGLMAPEWAWTTKRWQNDGAPSNNELILVGSGSAGLDQIYVGVSGYFNAVSDYYNWLLNGFTAYSAGPDFCAQAGAMTLAVDPPIVPMWNSPITFWLVANGRRIVLVTKISSRYEALYLGLIQPYATAGQYPYPLFVGGSALYGQVNPRWSSNIVDHRHFINPQTAGSQTVSSGRIRKSDGTWGSILNDQGALVHSFPYFRSTTAGAEGPLNVGSNIDGSYALWPIALYEDPANNNTYGELEGCYYLTGYNNAAENVVTISGVNYLVVQNVYQTGQNQYWALKLV